MDRRTFMKLGLVGIGAAGLGAAASSCAATGSSVAPAQSSAGKRVRGATDVSFGQSVDALIVGSGAAGLSAAMPLVEAGHSVVIAEKDSLLGGDSFLSTGIFRVVGSDFQKKAGVDGSIDDAWNAKKATFTSDERGDARFMALQEAIFRAQPEWIDKAVSYQAEFQDPSAYVKAGSPADLVIPKAGLGTMTGVLTPIRDALSEKGAVFRTNLTATNFIVNEKNLICGMRFYASESESNVDVEARIVIMATGGFACNRAMVHDNLPQREHLGVYPYLSDGSGIQMMARSQAARDDLSLPGPLIGDIPVVSAWGLFGPIVAVSPLGARFAREDDRNACAEAAFEQGFGSWWSIFDSQIAEGVQASSAARAVQNNPRSVVGPCNSLDDLAQAMRVDADALKSSFDEYDQAVEAGKDEKFGRTAFLKSLKPPYHAIVQHPIAYKTLGGVRTDERAQVLTATNERIANLLAAGSCAAGRSEGMAHNAAFGLIAGRTAVDLLEG